MRLFMLALSVGLVAASADAQYDTKKNTDAVWEATIVGISG